MFDGWIIDDEEELYPLELIQCNDDCNDVGDAANLSLGGGAALIDNNNIATSQSVGNIMMVEFESTSPVNTGALPIKLHHFCFSLY